MHIRLTKMALSRHTGTDSEKRLKKPVLTAMTFLFVLCVGRAADFPDMPPVKEGLWKIHSCGRSPRALRSFLCCLILFVYRFGQTLPINAAMKTS